jgi:predicted DCC family thiol-disulfide oxidoreductase YuxK
VNPEHGDKLIVLFDGVCNFCNGWVKLLIRHDRKDKFRFVPFQSEIGSKLQYQLPIINFEESVVLIERGKVYYGADAALRIFYHLGGLWKCFAVFYLFPKVLRYAVYSFISRNRYRWFGKRNACMVPDEKIKSKFIT